MFKKLLCFVLIACFSTACLSSKDSDSVIERSAAERPAWADGDFSGESKNEAYLVYAREEIYRLELGLKQVQSAAIRRTKDLVLSRARVEVSERAEKFLNNKANIDESIKKAVAKVEASKYMPADAAAKNVYWENLRKDTPEGAKTYYNVYVLLSVTRGELDSAVFRIAKRLSEMSDPNAKAAGDAIVKELSNIEVDVENE